LNAKAFIKEVVARLRAVGRALLHTPKADSELVLNINAIVIAWILLSAGGGIFAFDLYSTKALSASDAIALFAAFILSITALLAGTASVYAMLQLKAMRDQVTVTQFFERIKMTKAVLDDPKIVEPFRWLAGYLNGFPFGACLVDARRELHFQNCLSFSEHEDQEIARLSLDLMRTLTYLTQLSKYGALLDDLYFDRNALEVCQAYFCFQGIIDYSQRASFMTADIAAFAQRAWQWLRNNSSGTLRNYPQLRNGFAGPDELKVLEEESAQRAAAVRNEAKTKRH